MPPKKKVPPKAPPAESPAGFGFTLEEIDVSSDSTCRDSERCMCHWCKRAKLRQLGVRPSLRSRAADVGLDTDSPGWVCDLRGMGEISDDEWAELMGGWENSSNDSQPEPEAATSGTEHKLHKETMTEELTGDEMVKEPLEDPVVVDVEWTVVHD